MEENGTNKKNNQPQTELYMEFRVKIPNLELCSF